MKYNILFLNRSFYQYDKAIKDSLRKAGNNVFSYTIKPDPGLFNEILAHFWQERILNELAKKQQKDILEDLKKKKIKIDIVFVLAGQLLLRKTLSSLKRLYPDAKFVWYMWDNVVNVKEFSKNRNYFDRIIIFDKIDAKKYGLYYLPLFYLYEKVIEKKRYDLNFIGQAHSDRKKLITKVLKENNFQTPFIWLLTGKYTKLIYSLIKRHSGIYSYLHLQPLSYEKVIDLMARSKCVIDFPQPNQTGLTMRTIETIGTHTKLITSNKFVKQYDFYNPDNIYVIDTVLLKMPDKPFFDEPYIELDEEIKMKYSFQSWIDVILSSFNELMGGKNENISDRG